MPQYSTNARPTVQIRSLTFNDHSTVNLHDGEIIVFVGPNNSGKSATLREISSYLNSGPNQRKTVLSHLDFHTSSTPEEVERWAIENSIEDRNGTYRMHFLSGFHKNAPLNTWRNIKQTGLQFFANLLICYINTEARLAVVNPTDLVNFVTEIATHPLHRLHQDEGLERKIDATFHRAFGTNLIVNRGAGRQVMLHFGERSSLPNATNQLSNEFREAVHRLPAIHEQGDGIRAFVGVLASVLALDRDIVLVDEPEAFLHPPQAYLLGRFLAQESPEKQQLFIATHSTDFLRGILDHASPRVRVIRLRREGNINRITELTPDVIRNVWADPLLRYSKVLDGLFHDGVIVCEGDADCRFYGAMLDAVFGDAAMPDLAFAQGAGKSRIQTIVRSLKAIGVPVRVVVDFDVLSEGNELSKLVTELGGQWQMVEADWRKVKSSIDQRRAQLSTSEAGTNIKNILDQVTSQTLPEQAIRQIKVVLRRGSAWAEAKKLGRAFLPSGDVTQSFDRLSKELRRIGLFLVEIGELERFCPAIGGHGPGWVFDVLQRDLRKDPELAVARSFAEVLGSGWTR